MMNVVNFERFNRDAARLMVLVRVAVNQSRMELLDSVFQVIEKSHYEVQIAHSKSNNVKKDDLSTELIRMYFTLHSDFIKMYTDNQSKLLVNRTLQSLHFIMDRVFITNPHLAAIYFKHLHKILKSTAWNVSPISIDEYMMIDTFGRLAVKAGKLNPITFIKLSLDLFSSLAQNYPSQEVLRAYLKHAIYFEQDFYTQFHSTDDAEKLKNYHITISNYSNLQWSERIEDFKRLKKQSELLREEHEYILNDVLVISRKIVMIYLMALEIFYKNREDFSWEFEYTRPEFNRSKWLNRNPIEFEKKDVFDLVLNLGLIEELSEFSLFNERIEPNHFVRMAVCIQLLNANANQFEYVQYYLRLSKEQKKKFISSIDSLITTITAIKQLDTNVLQRTLNEVLKTIEKQVETELFNEYENYSLQNNTVDLAISSLISTSPLAKLLPFTVKNTQNTGIKKGLAFFPKDHFYSWKGMEIQTLQKGIYAVSLYALKLALKSKQSKVIKLRNLEKLLTTRKYEQVILLDIISDKNIYFDFFSLLGKIMQRSVNESYAQIGMIEDRPVNNLQTRDLEMPLLVLRKRKKKLKNTIDIDVQIEKRQDGIDVTASMVFELDIAYEVFKVEA